MLETLGSIGSKLLAPLIITLLGAYIVYRYQERAWKLKRNDEKIQSQKQSAHETISLLSDLLDKRLFGQRRMCWALVSDGELLEDVVKNFRETTFAWNENFTKIKASINIYFGYGDVIRLESEFGERFSDLTSRISILYRSYKKNKKLNSLERSQIDKIESETDYLGRQIFKFVTYLSNRIRLETVGNIKEIDDLYRAELEDISIVYLLRRLFNFSK